MYSLEIETNNSR